MDSCRCEQQFTVTFQYCVFFTRDVFSLANPVLLDAMPPAAGRKCARFAVFLDSGLAASRPELGEQIDRYVAAHGGALELAGRPVLVTGGEAAKNDPALVERLRTGLAELGIDRHSYVIAIGGGAVLDVIGYVAATLHRGIRHVRIPSTTLAQADSGVGVKNGVNALGKKNLIGTFAPPFAVINDELLLASLPQRSARAGLAEAVKVGLIRDSEFLHWLERNAEPLRQLEINALSKAVRRCAELHMTQIATGGDPFETGNARPLDYGHWSAHKLETMTGYSVLHGEAVAIGIALDTRYCVEMGYLSAGQDQRLWKLLSSLGFALWHEALERRGPDGGLEILSGLTEFKEHMGGELTLIMLSEIGRSFEVHTVDEARIAAAIGWLERMSKQRKLDLEGVVE
jgi:3-dehydroquinate synthase